MAAVTVKRSIGTFSRTNCKPTETISRKLPNKNIQEFDRFIEQKNACAFWLVYGRRNYSQLMKES